MSTIFLSLPSKVALVALVAFPVILAFIVAGNLILRAVALLPSKLIEVPVLVASASVIPIDLAVFNLVAVSALPVSDAFIVDGSFNVLATEPSTAIAVPVLVASASAIEILTAVVSFPADVAVAALPSRVALMVEGNLILSAVTLLPSKLIAVL